MPTPSLLNLMTRRHWLDAALATFIPTTLRGMAEDDPPPKWSGQLYDVQSGVYVMFRGEDGLPDIRLIPRWEDKDVIGLGPQPAPIAARVLAFTTRDEWLLMRTWAEGDPDRCRLCRRRCSIYRGTDGGLHCTIMIPIGFDPLDAPLAADEGCQIVIDAYPDTSGTRITIQFMNREDPEVIREGGPR
jgi:hypothetical protein